MTAGTPGNGASSAVAQSGKAKDTLSQFVARVLDQLSLSAWLPSTALILCVALVFQIGSALDRDPTASPSAALGAAFRSMADVSLGGAALFVVGIVVSTTITQAFEFEAIRVLEGYWGTNPIAEWFAGLRCARFRREHAKLKARTRDLTNEAWDGARRAIESSEKQLVEQGHPRQMTPNMIAVLEAKVLGEKKPILLTPEEDEFLRTIDWKFSAPPEPLRKILNVDRRLREFPQGSRILPTRLGNVLRSSEDATGKQPIESFIQEVFDDLPLSLRIEHDEERGRLDLYCSMVFVLMVVAAVVFVRLVVEGLLWGLGGLLLTTFAIWLMYRAAVASANAYGALLVVIARRVDNLPA